MRRLIIDTTSEFLSVALFDGDTLIGADHRCIGRGHAEQLVPAIAAFPDGGKASDIWVGCGPGSFTGTRVGIAGARALAFAWGAELKGFDSLALVAAQARRVSGQVKLCVSSEGGHGQWLVSDAPHQWRALSPIDAASAATAELIAGNRAAELVALRGWGTALSADTDAREALGMDAAALIVEVRALYAREPDAKPNIVAIHAI